MKAIPVLAKRMLVLLFCLGVLLTLTSCGSIDDAPMKKSEVDKRVASEVVNEKYTFVSVEHYEDELPKSDVYTYQSKERDLTFEAISTLTPVGLDASTIGYDKVVYVEYADAVRSQYADRMAAILTDFDRDAKGNLSYHSFDDLEKIAHAIAQLNDLYKEELAYNSLEWMVQNPLCRISFWAERVEKDGYNVSVFSCPIDSTYTYEDIYAFITYEHAKAAKTGKIADDTTPDEQLARVHEANLENIFYKGDNLSKIANENAFQNGLKNNVERSYYSGYYYPWDSYVIVLDCGLTDDDYAPKWMESYADALGFECKIQHKKGKISWTYEGSSYEMVTKVDAEGHISDFKISKDGKDLEIPYILYDDALSPVSATYVVGIPVDRFADLFHLDYQIKEEGKMIEFSDYWNPLEELTQEE